MLGRQGTSHAAGGCRLRRAHANPGQGQLALTGEESVRARRIAVRGDDAMRRALLQYNADDARATRAIREWMDRGAPGIRTLGTPEP